MSETKTFRKEGWEQEVLAAMKAAGLVKNDTDGFRLALKCVVKKYKLPVRVPA